MELSGRLLACVLCALCSVLAGLFVLGVPTKLGFFRLAAQRWPEFSGLAPAFAPADHKKWVFDFQRLAAIDLNGQTAIVTGANSGLGYATALHLARQGARVVLACRNESRCQQARTQIISNVTRSRTLAQGALRAAEDDAEGTTHTGQEQHVHVEFQILDTASLSSVVAFARAFLATSEPLHMLVLNAGISMKPFSLSKDGVENIFASNHLGHFALYNLLLPALRRASEDEDEGGVERGLDGKGQLGKRGNYHAKPSARNCERVSARVARVVVVSSAYHYQAYPWGVGLSKDQINNPEVYTHAYGQSKLCNVLFAQEAARREAAHQTNLKIQINSCHPGVVDTGIWTRAETFLGLPLWAVPWGLAIVKVLQKRFMWTAEEGALTQLFLVASDTVVSQGITGRYFHPQAHEMVPCPTHAANSSLQGALWDFSAELLLEFDPNLDFR